MSDPVYIRKFQTKHNFYTKEIQFIHMGNSFNIYQNLIITIYLNEQTHLKQQAPAHWVLGSIIMCYVNR